MYKKSKPVLAEIEEDVIKTLEEELKEFSENIHSLKDILIKQFDSVRLKFVVPLISDAYKKMMDENLEELKDEFLSRTKNSISYLMEGIQNRFSNQLEEISESFEKLEESQKDSIKRIEFEKKELDGKINKLSNDIESKDKLIEENLEQLNKLKTEIIEKESAIKDLSLFRDKFDSLTGKFKVEQEAKIRLEGESSSLKKQNDYFRTQIGDLNKKISESDNRVINLQKELNQVKSDKLLLENRLEELASKASDRPAVVPNEELIKIKTKVKVLEDEINEKENSIKTTKNLIDQLRNENTKLRVDNENKTLTINKYLKEIEKFKEELDKSIEYQKRITRLQYEFNELNRIKEKQESELQRIVKLKKMMESEPKFKILQILESVGEIPISTLNSAIGYTSIMTRKILNELSQADLVEFDGTIVRLKKE